MRDDRRARAARLGASVLFALTLVLAAIVPGRAWSAGTDALAEASVLDAPRVLVPESALRVEARTGAVFVSAGDGGGVGEIDGLDDAPLRVHATTFRGEPCWEIGTSPGRPATYVNGQGVRLDDGMGDRLRARVLFAPALLAAAALVAVLLARSRPQLRPAAPALLVLAALVLAARLG